MVNIHKETLLIIDFGSQLTQLIARRIRESNVYCEIYPSHKLSSEKLISLGPKAIILSGGPSSVTDNDCPMPPKCTFDLGVPVLGICYGQQIMTRILGGKVKDSHHREFGRAVISKSSNVTEHPLLEGLFSDSSEIVWMSHGDRVVDPPPGFTALAHSTNSPFAIIANSSKNLFGFQFHPEVYHTENGTQLLQNFIRISDFNQDWTMAAYRDTAIEGIRQIVGSKHVICALSGGVDSAVTAILLHLAIPGRVTCVFVDHGFLRKDEAKQVVSLFRDHFNIPLIHADESELFLEQLRGISEPELKRKTIGKLFIDVFCKHATSLGCVEFLAQGTLYPDIIESISYTGSKSSTIKSHHNVGGLPDKLDLKLIEPLRELFKDEVRKLGIELGIPDQFLKRHPFPGPGLAIRCIGEITHDKLEILRQADAIFIEQISLAGIYDHIWQAFVTLLPVRTVGVMGDYRTYDFVCALRAVTSVDGMTADYFKFDHEFLSVVANRIVNEVRGINRVTYDITSKPPGTIEWE